MRHLLIGTEYPPAPGGGIGTYMRHIATLLTEAGETVHVITREATGAAATEVSRNGRLIVHRLPVAPHDPVERALAAAYPPLVFAHRAALLAERLIVEERIDVVEGAEFEAPLHALQQRRALGLGPDRCPPILVHMHGASDVVYAQDLDDPGTPGKRMASRLEAASIARADHVLFPSAYYARQGTALYGLDPARISVIPYPVAPVDPLPADGTVWRDGPLLFIGRLERRKGILEWLDTAARLARGNPALRFEFAGSIGLYPEWGSGAAELKAAIPDDLRHCFRFHGHLDQAGLRRVLAAARIVLAPSRWDNLPYVCIEAMGAGRPVLTTATGGMPELVRDGREGWIAPSCAPLHLLQAAERALGSPPEELARLGAAARLRVTELCDNQRTLARHLELRAVLTNRERPARPAATPAPRVTVIAPDPRADNLVAAAALLHAEAPADAYLLCEPEDQPAEDFVAAALAVLAVRPEIAIVCAWAEGAAGGPLVAPDPDLPSLLLEDDSSGPLLVRAGLFDRPCVVQTTDAPALARWLLLVQALRDGWRCACLPQVLSRRVASRPPPSLLAQGAMRRALHARFPELVAAHAACLIAWAGSPVGLLASPREMSFREYQLMLARLRRRAWPLVSATAGQWSRRLARRIARQLRSMQG